MIDATEMDAKPNGGVSIEMIGMSLSFGTLRALDDVSLTVRAGEFHALLGENGAGKSTLVKCLLGTYRADRGDIIVNDREQRIQEPRDAHALGLGMVYQHFTLAPALSGAENLLISRRPESAIIDWESEHAAMAAFMQDMPFQVRLDVPAANLSAGEKQKLEIIKQLYLGRRFLVLDEPTSVMTPAEADEVLGLIHGMTRSRMLTVLMITHKFREVMAFADNVTVLRRGIRVGGGPVTDYSTSDLATMMVGEEPAEQPVNGNAAKPSVGAPVLEATSLRVPMANGKHAVEIDALQVASGEIVGIAGVSGNGQTELMEILTGQRHIPQGQIRVHGEAFFATREQVHRHRIRCVPEEPLRNACAPTMSVSDNLALRTFDIDDDDKQRFWLSMRHMRRRASDLIARFQIKTQSPDAPISSLSGGNVQRAVLARELSGDVSLLLVANPCFGLDFAAAAEIRARILAARDAGCAVLLISEDLDEIMTLADRILVMSEGRTSYGARRAEADTATIGRHMAGHSA